MNPTSITTGVFTITAQCLNTAKELYTLRDKYENASRTIVATCSESTVISASLSQLQSLLIGDSNHISDHLRNIPELYATFDTSLTGCMVIYSCLDDEVRRLSAHCHNADRATWKEKAKFVWDEDSMEQLLDSLRGQQKALTLLIQVLQTESLVDIKRLLQHGDAVISQVASRSRELRASHPSVWVPESIYESTLVGEGSMIDDAEVTFDDVVVNSLTAASRAKGKGPEVPVKVSLDSVHGEDCDDDSVSRNEPAPSSNGITPSIEVDGHQEKEEEEEEERPPLPPRRITPNGPPSRYAATTSNGRRSSSVASGSRITSSAALPASIIASSGSGTHAQSSTNGSALSGTAGQTSVPDSSLSCISSEEHTSLDVYDHWPSVAAIHGRSASNSTNELSRMFDFINFTDPNVRKTTLVTADDMQVRTVWDEILQSEILYVTHLRKLRSSFRDPILTQWPALSKHLEALKLLDEMIKLNEDHLLTPLTDQLAKPLTCADPMMFQTWYKEAGSTYRKYYERYPHAAAAIQTTIDVDSRFRKFVQQSDASAGKMLGLKDLLVTPMRQVESYCEFLRKAASMSFSSTLIAYQTTDFMKTCQMLKRFKASSNTLLEEAAWSEEMQSLKRRISSIDASFPEMLDITDKGRKIIYQGDVACKAKGKGSWTQVHAILLDNYLFWGTLQRPRAHWGGKWRSGEKLWIFEAPLSTTHLECAVQAKQEQAIKPSLLNEVPWGQELYPFTVSTITAKYVLGTVSRQQRQEWMDIIRSLRSLGVSNIAAMTMGAASIV